MSDHEGLLCLTVSFRCPQTSEKYLPEPAGADMKTQGQGTKQQPGWEEMAFVPGQLSRPG